MAKSTTQLYEFEGIGKWFKIYEPDEFRGSKRWSVNLYMDEANMNLYKRSGIQTTPKEDEDGVFVTFRRDTEKKIGKDYVEFTPPFIYQDGKTLVGYYNSEGRPIYQQNVKEAEEVIKKGENVLIGNGSTIKVRVEVYDTQMGKGSRLRSIEIVDMIEFSSGGRDVITAENSIDGPEKGEPVSSVDFSDLDTEPVSEKKGKKSKTPW